MARANVRVGIAVRRAGTGRSGGAGWLGLAAIAVGGLIGTLVHPPRPRLLWNASASLPVGLYVVMPLGTTRRGDIVIARLPAGARSLAAERGYLPARVPLIKRVAAVAGDRVCAEGAVLRVNSRAVALRQACDHKGRPMPWWRGCAVLAPNAVLLLGERPQSFDGRYFGRTDRDHLIGSARALWAR